MRTLTSIFRQNPALYATLALLLAATAILGTTLISQYGFGLRPCHLCMLQRYPYIAIILLSSLGLLYRNSRFAIYLLAANAVALVTSLGLAIYHAGVEKKIFAGPSGCTAENTAGMSIEELRKLILEKPLVMCDQPAFEFLGLSMAGWNVVASLLLLIFCLCSLKLIWSARV